ncbi:MAG: tRNA (adenosine(37)-N6)-dimethylallyltransferase MiaA [Taibaiella sp.]|nr:tRNA (adenosine(37)-N6)-dimethylallyltransferase MiaA [Taibaiella sp.]
MQYHDNTVYVIAGPTASGKTNIAIRLAQSLGTDIISADSRQCYKEMNIGTAKPSEKELQAVRHYFINEFSVSQDITAADFERLSLGYLHEIFQQNKNAIVCGGTGLYINALCNGLDEMPVVDSKISKEVNEQFEAKGLEWLQESITIHDPGYITGGEMQNPARIIRALVFKLSTGKSILDFRTGTRKNRAFNIIKVGLDIPREILYARINDRVDSMMKAGLLEEARGLFHNRRLKNLQTVGYSKLFDHLDGKYSIYEAVEKIKQHTRNYAKRQLTWFKKDREIHWVPADDKDILANILALKKVQL